MYHSRKNLLSLNAKLGLRTRFVVSNLKKVLKREINFIFFVQVKRRLTGREQDQIDTGFKTVVLGHGELIWPPPPCMSMSLSSSHPYPLGL